MYFENVQLPSTVIADLYKHSLVILDDDQPNAPIAAPAPEQEKILVSPAIEATGKIHVTEPLVPSQPMVPPHEMATETPVPTTQPIKYLGGFQKQVSIVVAEHFHPHIAEEDLEFLSKMLTACKLSINDVAIINVVNNPQSAQLWSIMPAKAMLLFDVDAATLGLTFRRPHFVVQHWAEAQFMSAPALEKFRIGNDADLKQSKGQLWLGLQQMFLGK